MGLFTPGNPCKSGQKANSRAPFSFREMSDFKALRGIFLPAFRRSNRGGGRRIIDGRCALSASLACAAIFVLKGLTWRLELASFCRSVF
jgi:hypothetical protein